MKLPAIRLPDLSHRGRIIIALILILVGIMGLFTRSAPYTAPQPSPTPLLFTDVLQPPPTSTPVSEPKPTSVPCPNAECLVITPAAVITPLRFDLPTPGVEPISAWRPPLYPVPWALNQFDHFYFARPIAADNVNWPLPSYRYGGVFFADVTHSGVDIPADPGVPVIAAGPGTVIWAGWGLFSDDPLNEKDAYGIAVAIRHDFGYQSEPLYTIYAHLSAENVTVGQWVNTGDLLGEVGDTGYTTGPHLHFEVRIGENSYFSTRNPELWIAPPEGWGVLAGRVMDSSRKAIHQLPVYIRSLDTNREWTVYTYGPEAVRPDDYYNENMVISDLPAGRYRIMINYDSKFKYHTVEIIPGQVTYFTFRGEYGYSRALPPPPTPDAAIPTP
jgi:murein DD-endopeptidase MepM/ murein hydrolase activator NlpD